MESTARSSLDRNIPVPPAASAQAGPATGHVAGRGMTMIGGLKIMSVKPGREQLFEQLFRELREEIRRNEPGCRVYALLSSRMARGSYVLHEQYADQAALDAHRASAHGARYFPQIRATLSGIEVEYFDCVVE